MVGLWHVHAYGPAEALLRLRDGIRRLNDSHGTINSATSGYHETVTAAYVRLLEQVLAAADGDLVRGYAAVFTSAVADRNVLLRFYSRDLLMSETAQREWVEPDLAPLSIHLP